MILVDHITVYSKTNASVTFKDGTMRHLSEQNRFFRLPGVCSRRLPQVLQYSLPKSRATWVGDRFPPRPWVLQYERTQSLDSPSLEAMVVYPSPSPLISVISVVSFSVIACSY
jgi:hypothetical protein